jgi:hypothetical protein
MNDFGSREDWMVLLPIIQAWVNGEEVERLCWDGHWKPVENMRSLAGAELRLKKDAPPKVEGMWSRKFREKPPGELDGTMCEGIITKKGFSDDVIRSWPHHSYYENAIFTPF